MKVNYIGIVAGILALISLTLPWWTMPMSGTIEATMEEGGEIQTMEGTMSGDISVYPYDTKMTTKVITRMPMDEMEEIEESQSESLVDGFSIWYGYVALALIVVAGVAGIVGSLVVGKNVKIILFVAVTLALLSVMIFVAHLQCELPNLNKAIEENVPFFSGFPEVGLFSSGSFNSTTTIEEEIVVGEMTVGLDYSTYLSFGFWLAVVATIIAFISLLKHIIAPPATPPTPES